MLAPVLSPTIPESLDLESSSTSLARSGSPARARPRRLSYARKRQLFLILLAAPAILYVLAIAVWPMAQGIFYSFQEYSLVRPAGRRFVGLDNYIALWSDKTARQALINTFVFTIGAVTIEFVFGLGIALLLWRDDLFNRIVLGLLLIPATVTPLVVGLIFKAMLNADYGVLGYFLAEAGISGPRGLLADPLLALPTLIAVDVWEWTPLMALILLAGLKSLPTDILEAAQVDGATSAQRFALIILPLLLPAAFLALVLRMMDAFRVFDIIYVSTSGGPGDATTTLMIHGVKQGLEFFNIGRASAVSNLITACIGVMAAMFIFLVRPARNRNA
ncbi:sugar ABC transporter permease [Labrys sp. LIt4]|nr:sugar ABC transporter permease [Labrys sp. LIt4]